MAERSPRNGCLQSQSGSDLPPVETSAGLRLRRAYGSERSRCHFYQARDLEREESVDCAEKRGEWRFLNRRFVWSAVWRQPFLVKRSAALSRCQPPRFFDLLFGDLPIARAGVVVEFELPSAEAGNDAPAVIERKF